MYRKIFGIFSLVLVLAVAFSGFSPASAQSGNGGGLSKHDSELLATAIANGQQSVMLLIASKPGANRAVANSLASFGATIRYRDDNVSYISAIAPTSKVEAIAQLDSIEAVNINELIPLPDPRPEQDDLEAVPTPPGSTTPPENSQMPTRDIGAPQFVAANPTYDGRGVKVGIIDTGIDLFTPELQTAKLLDGTPVRKIVDWVTFTDPIADGDPTWVNMATQVSVVGGSFTSGGVTYAGVPTDGTYRFGVFNEASLGGTSEYGIDCDPGTPVVAGSDLNRNGVCNQKFAVLWRTSDNKVWVDSNAEASFAGELAMTDYKVNYDIGTFGTDNPATEIRESVPFVVQTDSKNKFVNIGIVAGAHGTHVAGIATGKDFFGGAFDGAAPEAQVVAVRACLFVSGCTAHALIEGMIYLEQQSNVDVINMSIGGLPALNDGNNTRTILYNRLIDQYKAQMFLSAGNSYAGVNTVGDPSVATKVMSVGAYVHKDTWFNNYGATVAKDDGLFPFSSRGPREDGGLKPNIVAPGSAVSTIPKWEQNFPLVGPLPYGYDMFNGTSMAAPQATGGAALLISAAKQNNVQWKPDQLRQAIISSTRYLPGYDAYEQGNGIFQVGAAWDLLKTNIKTVEITSRAPVNTVLSALLATPGFGTGIYEREGLAAGDTGGPRTITFTRTSGGSKSITYNLTWVGDSAFSSAGSIALPLNTPVDLTVDIGVLSAGVHSALLKLDDPATTGIDYEVMNTVIAANQFNVGNNFSVSQSGSVDRADTASFFFNVPANTPAFKVDLTGINGRIRFLRYHPYGLSIDSSSTTGFQTGGTQSRTVSNPFPGVWEVMVEASRTSAANPSTFTVTGTILGVDIDPASWTIDPATVGMLYTQAFNFTNRFGEFNGGAAGTSLGSAFRARPTIAAGAPDQVYNIVVPPGSTLISARIGNASDTRADLDLFLYDCTAGATACVLKSSSTSSSAEEFVSSTNPAAGAWKVVVNPYAVPSGSTEYDYIDLFANPMFGSVSITDPAAVHPYNTSWSATASVTANAAPAAGRFLQGFVQVKSGPVVLGSAEVDLKNVAP